MEHNLDERSNYLESLQNFISQSYERLNFVTGALGWDLERFDEDKEMVACPLNAEHRFPVDKLESHLKRCKWKREGYGDDDIPLPESSCAASSSTSVVIDKELQERILLGSSGDPSYAADLDARKTRPVPQTANRILTDFTPGERLALYSYAVANTRSTTVVKAEELNVMYKKNEEARPKSKLELLMEMRDAKRRRISYRSKKVHTNRKSHLEILREVINNQMEFLEELNKPDAEEEEPFKRDPDPTSSEDKSKIVNDKVRDFEKTDPEVNFEADGKSRKQSPYRRDSAISLEQEAGSSRSGTEETCSEHKKLRYPKGSSYCRERFRSRDRETSRRRSPGSQERERSKEDRLDSRNRTSCKTERYWSHGDYQKCREKYETGGTKRPGDVDLDGETDGFSKKIRRLKESNESVSSPRSDTEPRYNHHHHHGGSDWPRNGERRCEVSSKRSRHLKKSSKSHKHKKKKKKRCKSSPRDSDKSPEDEGNSC